MRRTRFERLYDVTTVRVWPPYAGLDASFYRADNPASISRQECLRQKDGLKATEQFLESIGMRLRLGDLGCKLEDTQLITDLSSNPIPANLPWMPIPSRKFTATRFNNYCLLRQGRVLILSISTKYI